MFGNNNTTNPIFFMLLVHILKPIAPIPPYTNFEIASTGNNKKYKIAIESAQLPFFLLLSTYQPFIMINTLVINIEGTSFLKPSQNKLFSAFIAPGNNTSTNETLPWYFERDIGQGDHYWHNAGNHSQIQHCLKLGTKPSRKLWMYFRL